MTRRSKRELERAVGRLEDDSAAVSGLCLFTSPPPACDRLTALRTATKLDWEGQRSLGRGEPLLVATTTVQVALRGRLSHALADLRMELGIHIPLAEFLQYLHQRVEGDLPAGDDGIRLFSDPAVTAAHVDRVWRETVTAAGAEYPSHDSLGALEGPA